MPHSPTSSNHGGTATDPELETVSDTTNRVSRRGVLLGGGVGAAALFGGIGVAAGHALGVSSAESADPKPETQINPHGKHQPGIDMPQQAYATFMALDLLVADAAALQEFLADLGDVIAAIMRGKQPPEKALKAPGTSALTDFSTGLGPARLTVTVGLGPTALLLPGIPREARPKRLAGLPTFANDALDPRWSGGELLLQICADDAQVVSSAVRSLRARVPGKASIRWTQNGFISHPADGGTPRNMFGQKDGTANPAHGSKKLSSALWALPDEPSWFAGGTYLVFRKIRMKTAEWDLAPQTEHDTTIGRRRSDGAPLTGHDEFDTPDLDARNADGTPTIAADAHIRRVHGITMLRRGYTYDYGMLLTQAGGAPNPVASEAPAEHEHAPGTPPHTHGGHDSIDNGLLFCAYGNDPREQFVKAQQKMDEGTGDLLNRFIQTTGSGIYAILPGTRGGSRGASLFA
jgi:deferrochelatase/peroxidase EfeB